MVFRLPTQLETLVPPPAVQHPQPPPWRGSIVVTGVRNSDRSSSQEIFVTAVETDGEKYVDMIRRDCSLIWTRPSRAQQWPSRFFFNILHDQPVLRDFQAWVKGCIPPLPLCTFMPNRLRDHNMHTVNQTNFRSLSRVLFDGQTVRGCPLSTASYLKCFTPGCCRVMGSKHIPGCRNRDLSC